MKKKYRRGFIGAAVLASIMAVSPAYAEWSQNSQGWWYATSVDGTSWYSNCWQWIDGNGDGIAECYYFNADGYMLANTTTPDGYMVDANGGWVQNGIVQTKAQAGAAENAVTTATTTIHTAGSGTTAASAATSGKSDSNVIIANNSTIYTSNSDSSDSDLSDTGSSGSSSSSGNGTISSSNYSTSASVEKEEKDYSEYAQKCFELINKKRVANGLAELEWDDTIAEACNVRAEEITEKFSHVRPNGEICFTAFDEVGMDLEAEGENIAEGQSTPKLVVNAWMNSKGHKKNILKEGYTRSAIGFVYDPDSDYKYYWVQMFGRNRGE